MLAKERELTGKRGGHEEEDLKWEYSTRSNPSGDPSIRSSL
jgi:hypothetical protein